MQFKPHKCFHVQDRSHTSYTKREIARIAEPYGFDETDKGKIEIIVTELCSNILKHSALKGGEILVRVISNDQVNPAIEIISIDSGPGMADPGRMLEDGVSTSGTPGTGLGAISRLSHKFEIFSKTDNGTIVLVRYFKNWNTVRNSAKAYKFHISPIMVCKAGEIKCGDGGYIENNPNAAVMMVVDGLGHGPEAEIASDEAVNAFKENIELNPSEILRVVHNQIKRTRGVVGTVVKIDVAARTFLFAGIGNISGRIINTEYVKNLISYNGTVGHNIPTTIHDHTYPLPVNSLLVLNSDGIKTRWDLSKYGDIYKYDPAIIAALIYRDNTRNTDDVLVVVGKITK